MIYSVNGARKIGHLHAKELNWIIISHHVCRLLSKFIGLYFILLCRYIYISYNWRLVTALHEVKSVGFIFQQCCLLHISVSHFSNSCSISNFFVINVFVMMLCDQWSLILLLWLTEGSCVSSIFLNWGMYIVFSRHNINTHVTGYNTV